MRKIALIVEYETHPGKQEEFEAVIRAHAQRCLDEEPSCLRFEVLRPLNEQGTPIPNRFMANELFEDQAALTDHRSTTRFEKISEQFRMLLVNRRPILCEVEI